MKIKEKQESVAIIHLFTFIKKSTLSKICIYQHGFYPHKKKNSILQLKFVCCGCGRACTNKERLGCGFLLAYVLLFLYSYKWTQAYISWFMSFLFFPKSAAVFLEIKNGTYFFQSAFFPPELSVPLLCTIFLSFISFCYLLGPCLLRVKYK